MAEKQSLSSRSPPAKDTPGETEPVPQRAPQSAPAKIPAPERISAREQRAFRQFEGEEETPVHGEPSEFGPLHDEMGYGGVPDIVPEVEIHGGAPEILPAIEQGAAAVGSAVLTALQGVRFVPLV